MRYYQAYLPSGKRFVLDVFWQIIAVIQQKRVDYCKLNQQVCLFTSSAEQSFGRMSQEFLYPLSTAEIGLLFNKWCLDEVVHFETVAFDLPFYGRRYFRM